MVMFERLDDKAEFTLLMLITGDHLVTYSCMAIAEWGSEIHKHTKVYRGYSGISAKWHMFQKGVRSRRLWRLSSMHAPKLCSLSCMSLDPGPLGEDRSL